MDAIDFLVKQHREIEDLFARHENASEERQKRELFERIADALAIHFTVEERFFYPALRGRQLAEHLPETYDDHLEVKDMLVDALHSVGPPNLAALEAALRVHVQLEESLVLPAARALFGPEAAEELGRQLEGEAAVLARSGHFRREVEAHIECAPHSGPPR